jgi:proline racemase
MKPLRIIHTIDTHTAGEPTRVVISGLPKLSGHSIAQKIDFFRKNYDHLRRALIFEPRGHSNMVGAVITSSTVPKAKFGIFFMCPRGYPMMCGHGTIGAVTALFETGKIQIPPLDKKILIDTALETIEVELEISDAKMASVKIKNVPAFVILRDIDIKIPSFGKITLDISFAGNSFYALVDTVLNKISTERADLSSLIKLGLQIRDEINRTVDTVHPEKPDIKGVSAVDFFGKSNNPKAHFKDIHVYGTGQIDRSPCGNGTCAMLANLYCKHKIGLNQDYIQEGISGDLFYGRILDVVEIGEHTAIVPELKGSAFITGINQLIIDKRDPLKYGFSVQ